MTFSYWVNAEGWSSEAHLHTNQVDGQICGKFTIFKSSFIPFFLYTINNPNFNTVHVVLVYQTMFTVLLLTRMLIRQGLTTANL